MIKFSFLYFLRTYGILIIGTLIAIIAAIVCARMQNYMGMFVFLCILIFLPLFGTLFMISYVHKSMKKHEAVALDQLEKQGFVVEYTYTSRNAIFFINYSAGKMAALYGMNPTHLQMIDPTQITFIRTNDHKVMNSTSCVSCDFILMGKKYSINTLLVTGGGTLIMKSSKVLEAISKADQLCEMLKITQENAKAAETN